MKGVRITRSNWVNDWIGGDVNSIRVLTDQQAYEAVEVFYLAVYAPEYDPVPVSEIPVVKTGVELIPETPTVIEFPAAPAEPDVLDDADEDDAPPLAAPWTSAPKAAWIEWAVHKGADPVKAASLTKNELLSLYSGRL